jgi:hypothetical protein
LNFSLGDLKSKLRSNDRAKDKLYDEVQDLKRKLKEQQRVNKEIDDKYSRYKDCLYRSKAQLNKLLDDYNDTIKRNQPKSNDTSKTNEVVTSSSSILLSTTTASVSASNIVAVGDEVAVTETSMKEETKEQDITAETKDVQSVATEDAIEINVDLTKEQLL